MALIPSSAALPALGYLVTEKLAKSNHSLWKAQITSALKGAKMVGYVDGTIVAWPQRRRWLQAPPTRRRLPTPISSSGR
jgi:hypothetical protein